MVHKRHLGRRLFSTFLFATLLAAWNPLGRAEVSKTTEGPVETIHVRLKGLDFGRTSIEGREFLVPKIKGAGGYSAILYREGYPEIPVVRFYVSDKPTVSIIQSKTRHELLPEDLLIKPSQPSHPKVLGAMVPFTMDESFYARDEFWPNQAYSIEEAGSVRGQKQYLVSLFPVSYNPARQSFKWLGEFVVSVAHTSPFADGPSKPEAFAFIVGKNFLDSPSLKEYQDFKRSLGYITRTIAMGQDASTADQIRQKLQALLSDKTFSLRHALIIGDASDVPGYQAHNISGVTDHYYRAIDTKDYESDINGPDIGLGRIAVNNETQLAAVLAKYTKYQKGVFKDEEWLRHMSFLASNDSYNWETAEKTHNFVIDTYTASRGYTGNFPKINQPGGDKLYAITYEVPDEKVQEALRAGRTFIDYSGHGSTTDWDAPSVTQANIRAITHSDALPFTIGNACYTGNFSEPESFGETWQRHPQGAITYWGSYDSSYWDEDDVLERGLIRGFFDEHLSQFGDMMAFANKEVWREYGGQGKSKYYWESYVTFGDPSILWRTSATKLPGIQGPQTIPAGVTQLDYGVFDANGRPLPKARLGLASLDRSLIVSATTDLDGFASFQLPQSLEPLQGSKLALTVYGDDLRLSNTEIQITDPNIPFLRLSDISGGVLGRRDVYVGESVNLTITVQNIGKLPTAGGTLKLENLLGPATVISAEQKAIHALQPGQTEQISLATLRIKDSATPNEPVTLRLRWKLQETAENVGSAVLRVLRGHAVITAIDAGQGSIGTGIKPGATGNAIVTVKNFGNEPLKNALLTPLAGNCVEQVSGELRIPELPAGSSIKINEPIKVATSKSCKNGELAVVKLKGTYESRMQQVALPETSASIRLGIWTLEEVTRDNLSVAIPEGEPGAIQPLDFAKKGTIEDIGLRVKLKFGGFTDNLKFSLVHPDGTRIELLSKTLLNSLDVTFGIDGKYPIKEIVRLRGMTTDGTWKIIVQDASGDVKDGAILAVGLKIKGYFQ